MWKPCRHFGCGKYVRISYTRSGRGANSIYRPPGVCHPATGRQAPCRPTIGRQGALSPIGRVTGPWRSINAVCTPPGPCVRDAYVFSTSKMPTWLPHSHPLSCKRTKIDPMKFLIDCSTENCFAVYII